MLKSKRKFQIASRHFPALLLRLGIVLLFYFISRLLFLIFNAETLIGQLDQQPISYWLWLFVGGMRFDLLAITFINFPFIFFTLLPFRFRQNKTYRKTTELVLFYIPNIIAFATDYIDIIYSRFTQKRMTCDVFRFLDAGNGFFELLPDFLSDFWYIFLIFIAMMLLFIKLNLSIKVQYSKYNHSFWRFFVSNLILLMSVSGLCLIAARGGLQLRPISIASASHYAQPEHYSLVLNTPFTLIKTIDEQGIEKKEYFTKKELNAIYQPIYHFDNDKDFKPNNVVIIILEGISAEYSKLLNPKLSKSFTPVLDSIALQGEILLAYANGTRSMEGIPAVLAGLPTLMNNEYLTSNYSENQITSLPILLKSKEYTSAFFHGGKNGTMNFDLFTHIAGFDYYYGKDEYNNDADYDGSWGIFDDRFLPYCVEQLDTITTPFFASIFMLSSHHPYTIPTYYPYETEPNMKSAVTYSDWALGKFFKAAAQKSWFHRTLFVIVSDHATSSEDPLFNSQIGKYKIPLVFYHPTDTIPKIHKPFAQQIDIMPSVLDMMNYSDSIFSFGHSIFENDSAFAINYLNSAYQLITNNLVINFDGKNLSAVYHYQDDPSLKNNLVHKIAAPAIELNFLKAFVQTYNTALIDNKLTIKNHYER